MAKYKQTEIGMIPVDWETTTIGKSVSFLKSGISRPFESKNVGIPVLRSGNVKNGKINLINLKYWYKEDPKGYDLSKIILKKDDILINFVNGSVDELGKSGIYKEEIKPCIVTTNFFIVRFNEQISPDFFNQIAQTQIYKKQIKSLFRFGNQGSFNMEDLQKIIIPLPNISEQKKISEIIFTIDKRLDILERERKKVEQLMTGIMKELLHEKKWKLVKLGDENFFELIMGQSPPSESYNNEGIGLPFMQGNSEFGATYPEITVYCSKPVKIAKSGDILMSVRAPVGEINIANKDCCLGRGVGAIRPKKDVDTEYLFYILRSMNSKLDSISGGSTFKAITKGQLENFEIALPPIQEQKRISQILSIIDKKLSIQNSKKFKLNKIKKSLMNDLLIGKKRVKVTN